VALAIGLAPLQVIRTVNVSDMLLDVSATGQPADADRHRHAVGLHVAHAVKDEGGGEDDRAHREQPTARTDK